VCTVLVGKPERKRPLGDPDVVVRIILRWIFRNLAGVVRTGWGWISIWRGGGGTCECGKKLSGSIKMRKIS
jgi:hypothetical protein